MELVWTVLQTGRILLGLAVTELRFSEVDGAKLATGKARDALDYVKRFLPTAEAPPVQKLPLTREIHRLQCQIEAFEHRVNLNANFA